MNLTGTWYRGIITTVETQTIKIWKSTLKKLRMIHALTGESMVAVLERVINAELKRVREIETNRLE
jgi:ribosomal protein L5